MTPAALGRLVASGAAVHVVGLASTEGTAIARFLWARGVRDLTVHDFLAGDDLRKAFMRLHVGMPRPERLAVWQELASLPTERRLGPEYLKGIDEADAVFAGQGWYLYAANYPTLPALRERGVPFHSLTELYFGLSNVPIVAVTGSNGKSTTSRLVESMLRERPRGRTFFAGNERRSVQVLDKLSEMADEDLLVLEVSNRQLLEVVGSPHVGVLTNILPNHLEEHGGSFTEYMAVKRRLFEGQSGGDHAVLNADDEASRAIASGLPSQAHWFGLAPAAEVSLAAWLDRDTLWLRGLDGEPEVLLATDQMPLQGRHNIANTLAAALAARLSGAPTEAIRRGMSGFRPLRHRLQLVWRHSGVAYYDDLNSTSPQAAAAALETLGAGVHWIAGGDDKGLEYGKLARVAQGAARRLLLLPGPGSDRLAEAVAEGGDGPEVVRHERLADAVADAVAAARPGESVLLSPACPGFFSRHYLEDGVESGGFKSILRDLTAAGD